MALLNKVALSFLLLGKFLGLFGVALGFVDDYHQLGGYFLIAAFTFVKLSIICALIQTTKDKETFSIEDEEKKELRSFREVKNNLEQEILRLEEKKNALLNFELKRGKT